MQAMELKTIGSFLSSEEIIYPFNIHSVRDIFVHRSKKSCEVFSLSNYQNATPTKFILSAAKTPSPKDLIRLNINKTKVFESASRDEKHYLMLHPYLLPDCTLKNIHYIKSEISPYSEHSEYMLACLTTAGCVELYNYRIETCEMEQIDVNLLELRKNALKNPSKEITKFNDLIASFNELAFVNFEWCSYYPMQDVKLLMCVTKSDDLILYHIQETKIVEAGCFKIEEISRNKLKWISLNGKFYLLVTTHKGNLVRYLVHFGEKGALQDIKKVDTVEGKLKMPVSFMTIDQHEAYTLIFCCKGHTLEIFEMSEEKLKLIGSQYVDISITGFQVCDNLEYLLCTLNSRVYYMQLNKTVSGEFGIKIWQKLDITSAEGFEVASTDHAFYGIATSRNKVMAFISCYPQNAFDHLVNKQPNHISINLFTKYDPIQIIINNPTLKLTDYVDCVEAIRYIGLGKFETLNPLESMNYDISINRQFLYYLKVQLLIINLKLLYYQMKSQTIYDTILETKEMLQTLILAINGHMLLDVVVKTKSMTDIHYAVIKSLKKLITKYCTSTVDKEPFMTALELLNPQMTPLLNYCDEQFKANPVLPEVCSFCEEVIDENKMECSLNHKIKRCVATNLLVPIDCNNYCKQCKESVSSLEVLSSIIEDESTGILLCPLCDLKLVLNE